MACRLPERLHRDDPRVELLAPAPRGGEPSEPDRVLRVTEPRVPMRAAPGPAGMPRRRDRVGHVRTAPLPAAETPVYRYKLPFVIAASAAGTVIEWYDFYLYGVLAAFFATQFFPPGNEVAALLSSLATFGAGFAVRPFGAAFFGRIGDIIGRKFTFLVTISLMGGATALVGVLPTYAQIGVLAPIILVFLRLAQGLALGGEYGGAAIYVAEHCAGPSARQVHQLDPDHCDRRTAAGPGRHRGLPGVDG